MAKSFVLTNRKRLDAFLKAGGQLEDLGLVVGQLSGKPKYPKGHVGRRSREAERKGYIQRVDPDELRRRRMIRDASRQLAGLDKEQRKETRKRMVAYFKKKDISFRGLGRKGRAPAVAVARVAGVIAADRGTGQYHKRAIEGNRAAMEIDLQKIQGSLILGADTAKQVTTLGRNVKKAIRQSFRATGHVDTGRLLRNIQFQLFTKSGRAAVRKANKEANAPKTAHRRAKKAFKQYVAGLRGGR